MTGRFSASSLILCCLVLTSFMPLDAASNTNPDIKVEWQVKDLALPFTLDPETDSGVVATGTKVKLTITDPGLNANPSSAETVILTPEEDGDDLTMRIEDSSKNGLVDGDEITDCSGFGPATFTETGANTGIFSKIFVADNCGLDPGDLADARLIAEYGGRSEYATFRGHDGKLETSSKAIYTGLEITLTVTDQDQNKDADAAENVKVEIEPDGLGSEFVTLVETGKSTGIFSKKLKVGSDFGIADSGFVVSEVVARYVDAVASDGSTQEKVMILSPDLQNAAITITPSSKITPNTKMVIKLADRDMNQDSGSKDVIDSAVLRIETDNDRIARDRIELGEDGLRMEETDKNSGVFQLTVRLVQVTQEQDKSEIAFSVSLDELEMPAEPGDRIVIIYKDRDHNEDGKDTIETIMDVESFDPVIRTDKNEYNPDDAMTVTISDPDANLDPDLADKISVKIYTDKDIFGDVFSASETGADTGNFSLKVSIVKKAESDAIMASLGDTIFIEYKDQFPGGYSKKEENVEFTAEVPVGKVVPAAESAIAAAPVIKDFTGKEISNVTVGRQVLLSTEIENDLDRTIEFVAIVEVRNHGGITMYLAWQTGTLDPEGRAEVGLPWIPGESGDYEVRTFVMSSLSDSPQVLSGVKQSEVTVS